MKNVVWAGAAILMFTTPAAAEYYVVREGTTSHCGVVEEKPTGGATTVILNSEGYKTRPEAEKAMAEAAEECKAGAKGAAAKTAPTGGGVQPLSQAPANAWSISRIHKQAVYNPNNERIGEIDDVLVNAEGRAMALVVGIGGFLGIGETHVLVPFDAVKIADREGSARLVINTTREELKGATRYEYVHSKYLWVPEVRREPGAKKTPPG